jgi:hypothetical protein
VLRFAVEAVFLGLLAAALVVADRSALEIAGVMLLGWLVVALYEWAATRERAHYGRGLPPRYYVPQVALPPPRPLDQLPSAYPAAELVDEEPTWTASPAMLADWPVATASATSAVDDTVVDDALFAAIAEEARKEAVPPDTEPEPERLPDPEPVAAVSVGAEGGVEADIETAAAAVVVAKPEPESVEDAGELEAEVDDDALAAAGPASASALPGPARYTFDPFAETAPKRRFRRAPTADDGAVEVSARPPVPAGLPGRARE